MSRRQLEDASDALARFDFAVGAAPPAFARVLRSSAISGAMHTGRKGTRSLLAGLTDPSLRDLHSLAATLDDEERRARGGAPLSLPRLDKAWLARLGAYALEDGRREDLERVLRIASTDRVPALDRALEAAACLERPEVAEPVAALILVSEGRMDSLRMLPFGDVEANLRTSAIAAWHAGERDAWEAAAFVALAQGARRRRASLERALSVMPAEDGRVRALGRAAINARRALDVLRETLVTTVPQLAADLALSRPAASDAVERLVSMGIAEELSGRRRDRVFAYATALTMEGAS